MIKNCYFATAENELFLFKKDEYLDFINELYINNFNNIVLIGYSFFKKNDCDIYDVVTHDLIRGYFSSNKCKVTIFDQNPEFSADILLKSATPEISCQKTNWAALTHSMMEICKSNYFNLCRLNETALRSLCILYDYYNIAAFEDKSVLPYYFKSSKTHFLV